MSSKSQIDREIEAFVAEAPHAGSRDVTRNLLDYSSQGSGERPRLVASARPARELTPTLSSALDRLRATPDRTMGYTSKPLAYSGPFRYLGKRDHTNLIRLIRGGCVHVCEVLGAPPHGSVAYRDSPYGDRYYVLHLGPCGE